MCDCLCTEVLQLHLKYKLKCLCRTDVLLHDRLLQLYLSMFIVEY